MDPKIKGLIGRTNIGDLLQPAGIGTGQSFQDFLRTYVPPKPSPVQNPIDTEAVCPRCLDRFAPGTISSNHPFCSDCSSEGIDFEVKPIAEFLAERRPEDFDDMLARWESTEGFLPEYKAVKSERILQLKALKLAGR